MICIYVTHSQCVMSKIQLVFYIITYWLTKLVTLWHKGSSVILFIWISIYICDCEQNVHVCFFSEDIITINHKDSRWVGAWWLGFLITGGVMLLAGIPFWFLPRSLLKQGETETEKKLNVLEGEQDRFIPDNNKHSTPPNKPAPVSMAALAKGVHFIKIYFAICLLLGYLWDIEHTWPLCKASWCF